MMLEYFAHKNNIPIMQKDGIKFLTKYIKENNIKNILEIGSAIGYSSIKMALVNKDIRVTTIERDKIRYIVRDIKNVFRKQEIFVKINGEKYKVLGRLGMYHVTIDITGKSVNINDEVLFEVSPMLVDSRIKRKYI